MALFCYFEKQSKDKLPDPSGSLSLSVPSSSISAANAKVGPLLVESAPTGGHEGGIRAKPKRGHYAKFTPAQKAMIGKRAAEHGVVAALRHFIKKFPDLKENTIRDWRDAYKRELKKAVSEASCDAHVEIEVAKLPEKKKGRPLLVGEALDKQVQDYLLFLRLKGAVVNTSIAMGCAEGIVANFDANMLASNGGHIVITKTWAKSLMQRMGFVKRRATTKSKVSIEDFQDKKEQFLIDIKTIVTLEEVPLELIINWDQTAMHYIPVSSWTMDAEGSRRVEIKGIDDKRQITAVFACSMHGSFLPVQLIYQGKTEKCHPSFQFPKNWHIAHSPNHWCNEGTMKEYITQILVPYVKEKREDLHLSPDHRALVIYDKFKAQCTRDIVELLEQNDIDIVTVPANCTDRLQPLDVSVNKAAKSFMHSHHDHHHYTRHYVTECAEMQESCNYGTCIYK